MARYDRVAGLPAPRREEALPGWGVLRDLEGYERDADLVRRARLRFLALRPVRRLLRRGPGASPDASIARQIGGVREELGHLSARDPERLQLARLLQALARGLDTSVVDELAALARFMEQLGHLHAAEELAGITAEAAAVTGSAAADLAPRIDQARLAVSLGRIDAAVHMLATAYTQAVAARDQQAVARVRAAQAAWLHEARADIAQMALLELHRLETMAADSSVRSTAATALAEHELRAGNLELALEHGWTALRASPETDRAALRVLGIAFARLGLQEAARRCFAALTVRMTSSADRLRLVVDEATAAAAGGAVADYRSLRTKLLGELPAVVHARGLYAQLHLELARGALTVGDSDHARDHLRECIVTSRRYAVRGVLTQADELLARLEQNAVLALAQERPRSMDVAHRIAAALDSMPDALVLAGS